MVVYLLIGIVISAWAYYLGGQEAGVGYGSSVKVLGHLSIVIFWPFYLIVVMLFLATDSVGK